MCAGPPNASVHHKKRLEREQLTMTDEIFAYSEGEDLLVTTVVSCISAWRPRRCQRQR